MLRSKVVSAFSRADLLTHSHLSLECLLNDGLKEGSGCASVSRFHARLSESLTNIWLLLLTPGIYPYLLKWFSRFSAGPAWTLT
jgi:hypothetical protein